jgi:hypothetical protein
MKKIILTEAQVRNLLSEQISAIKKDKDKQIFDYNSLTDEAWNELVHEAQEIQRINFDLENNDSRGQKKTLYVKKNLRKDQPVKYEFNAELMDAGGDWEMPVMYFRVEFTHDYFYGKLWKNTKDPKYSFEVEKKPGKKLYKCYVIIPPAEAGNKIIKGESSSGKYDWHAYQNDGLTKEDEKIARITDADEKNCWKWLEDLLLKLVEDNHEMLDEPDRPEPSDTAPDRTLSNDKKSSN